MSDSGKPSRFTIVRLEERIAPGAMGGFCGHGSNKGSGKGSHKKGSGKKGGGYCPPKPCYYPPMHGHP